MFSDFILSELVESKTRTSHGRGEARRGTAGRGEAGTGEARRVEAELSGAGRGRDRAGRDGAGWGEAGRGGTEAGRSPAPRARPLPVNPQNAEQMSWTPLRKHERIKPHVNRIKDHDVGPEPQSCQPIEFKALPQVLSRQTMLSRTNDQPCASKIQKLRTHGSGSCYDLGFEGSDPRPNLFPGHALHDKGLKRQ